MNKYLYMFWGCKLSVNSPFKISSKKEKLLHLSHATLHKGSDKGKSSV